MSEVTSKLPNGQRELELIEKARKTVQGMDHIIKIYMILVKITANVWRKQTPLPIEDLHQEGVIGLMKAVKRFDPSFNTRFYTYAISCITGEIRNALRSDRKHTTGTVYLSAAKFYGRNREHVAELDEFLASSITPYQEESLSDQAGGVNLRTIMSKKELEFIQIKYNLEI